MDASTNQRRANLAPGMVVAPTCEQAMLDEPYLVLHVDVDSDAAVLIPIEPRRVNKRIYFRGYRTFKLSKLELHLDPKAPLLSIKEVKPRPVTLLSERQLNEKFSRGEGGESAPVRKRRRRWALIGPMVSSPDAVLLFDHELLLPAIRKRAGELTSNDSEQARQIVQIRNCLHQFWAGGSVEDALIPFSSACGGRGQRRKSKGRKLGRHNKPTKDGQQGREGFIPKEEDIDIMRWAWRNLKVRGTTIAKACRRMWREFYSTLETDERGHSETILLPQEQRPTPAQFRYWGENQAPNQEAWKRQLGAQSLERNWRALPGSATDDIYAAGQRGGIDSTPPDINFVSLRSRLKRIGPGNRILIVDHLYGYMPGFYMGLEAPSAKTVNLAVLHALSEKAEWLTDLGLDDIPPEDWIPMHFTHLVGDNTDTRAEAVRQSLLKIGTNLIHVPVRRSDLNSMAEAGHHHLHRLVDHNMLGTTYGRPNERGDEPADDRARHHIIEGIRETARAIHTHNTMELDIILPLAMERDGVRPTRLDMTRWSIEKHKRAMSPVDTATARSKLLMHCRGTFTESGVKLLRDDMGDKRAFIEPLRYVSRHPRIMAKMALARRGGKQRVDFFDDDFAYDPYRIRRIFYFDPDEGMITLDLVTNDRDLPFEASMHDVIDRLDHHGTKTYFTRDHRDQKLSRMEAKQDETKKNATEEYEEEHAALAKPLSKAAQRANKQENRAGDDPLMRDGMPLLVPAQADLGAMQSESLPLAEAPPRPAPPNNVPGSSPTPRPGASRAGSLLDQAIARRRKKIAEHA